MLRVPQISLPALLSQDNPHIDLKLQAYETSTKNFLKAVTDYKESVKAQISDRRNKQLAEKKKFIEKIKAVEEETEKCKLKEIELVAALQREQEERKDAELSVAAFQRQLNTLKDKGDGVQAQIDQYRAITENLKREKQKERATLAKYAAQVAPELDALERRLGCVIEGIESNQLLVRFSRLDKTDLSRDFSFIIDVSDHVYKIKKSSPVLPSLHQLVDELNDSRDIFAFIIRVREEYQATL